MRKLEKITKQQCDVLIVDHITSYWVEYCIPNKLTQFTLKIHNTAPFVASFSFLYSLIGCIMRTGLSSVALMSAIVLELKPRVIITLADNNKFMGALQTIFPDILVISAQNGIRATDDTIKEHGKYLSTPHYFGFGDYELSNFEEKNISVKKYYSTGSLRMGVFAANFYQPTAKKYKHKNICIVSQYVGRAADERLDLFYLKFTEMYRSISELTFKFSKEFNVDVCVAMRSEVSDKNYQGELMLYKSIFGENGVTLYANDRKKMLSYQVGMDADLIISFDSTLLFELLGLGKKVLCCGNADREYRDLWRDVNGFGNKGQCDLLPNDLLLEDWSYDNFQRKVNKLLDMDHDDFMDESKYARRQYMNFGSEYPHRIIYNAIQKQVRQPS